MTLAKCNACGFEAPQAEMEEHVSFHQKKQAELNKEVLTVGIREGHAATQKMEMAAMLTTLSFKHDKTVDEVLDRFAESLKAAMESGLV